MCSFGCQAEIKKFEVIYEWKDGALLNGCPSLRGNSGQHRSRQDHPPANPASAASKSDIHWRSVQKQRFPGATDAIHSLRRDSKMNYFLDNDGNNLQLGQDWGREVQVTGILNRAGDTIHAQSIKRL
jgi:hypothetical protein